MKRVYTRQLFEYVIYYILLVFSLYTVYWLGFRWDYEELAVNSFASNIGQAFTSIGFLFVLIFASFFFSVFTFKTFKTTQE